MSSKERLTLLLSYLQTNISALAKSIRVSPTALYHIINERNDISENLARSICDKYPELSFDWLVNGTGNLLKDENAIDPMAIPLVEFDYRSGTVIIGKDLPRYRILGFEKSDFLLRVVDNTMAPMFSTGDILGCQWIHNTDEIVLGSPYLFLTSQGGFIRRAAPGSDNKVKLISPNSSYFEFEIDKSKIASFAKIIGGVIYF